MLSSMISYHLSLVFVSVATVRAGYGGHGDYGGHGTPDNDGGCTFTISPVGEFPAGCEAGQLPDGQIRLNGSYPGSEFTISGGKITDSNGFGCIVTEHPTTQFQCDENKTPATGFAIDANNTLSYNGSPQFWACPATETEYNVYVHPDFGQKKCVPIGLATSGCGTPLEPPSCPISVSVSVSTITVTVSVTNSAAVPPPVTSSLSITTSMNGTFTRTSTALCHKCTASRNSTGLWGGSSTKTGGYNSPVSAWR